MLKAAIYARYSSGLQKVTSIDDHIVLCREAALRFNCLVLEDQIYTDQEISGMVGQRQAYIRLMNAAKTAQFEAFLIEAQDRLWRDQGEMHSALQAAQFRGIKVFSVSTGTDLTDKTGKLMASVVGWKDEVFAEDLRDKTRPGMMGQVKRGFSAGGRAYGYRSEPIYDPVKKDVYGKPLIVGSRRVINPEEAPVVVRIFKMYAAGLSPKTIVRRLNEEKVLPPRARQNAPSKRGWTWTTVAGSPKRSFGILNNPYALARSSGIAARRSVIRTPAGASCGSDQRMTGCPSGIRTSVLSPMNFGTRSRASRLVRNVKLRRGQKGVLSGTCLWAASLRGTWWTLRDQIPQILWMCHQPEPGIIRVPQPSIGAA